ncbi:MAG: methyl-accepting chemotaxis protein [Pseudomonadota bacterium]
MVKQMTLGKRIASVIGLMLILTVFVGTAGYFGLTRILHVTDFFRDVNAFQSTISSVKGLTDQVLLANFSGDTEGKEKARKRTLEQLDQGLRMVLAIKENSVVSEENSGRIPGAIKGISVYSTHFNRDNALQEEKMNNEKDIMKNLALMEGQITKAEMFIEEIGLACRVLSADFSAYVNKSSTQNWDIVIADTTRLGKGIDEWYLKIENSDMIRQIGDQIKAQFKLLKTSLDSYLKKVEEQIQLRKTMNAHINSLVNVGTELGRSSLEKLQAQALFSNRLIIGFIIAALLLGLLYGTFSTRKIVRIIKSFINGVSDAAEQVASGARQVSNTSQALADGASEQAASLEESSSSLEEMSSMVKQNAGNAEEAKGMMAEATKVLSKVNAHMTDMSGAMDEINTSSEETGKIIKTIDEIAFQTNLLALNAAVEAARAGEAGAGFAVVADEVRNLAMRAAEAAKNTANLIENTIKTVKNGAQLTKLTQQAFHESIEISGKVSELVQEIAAASREQSEGIEQVNRSVSQMDQVVQQNAAGSEESASASQEMSAQSESMKEMVNDVANFVGSMSVKRPRTERASSSSKGHKKFRDTGVKNPDKSGTRKALGMGPAQMRPPADEKDFQDF